MRSGLGLPEVAVAEDASRCSVCGSSLMVGCCLSCDTRRWSRVVHRELVLLLVLIGITVAAFFGTRAVAHSNDALHRTGRPRRGVTRHSVRRTAGMRGR